MCALTGLELKNNSAANPIFMKSQASTKNIRTFLILNQLIETLFDVLRHEQAMNLMVTFSSTNAPTQKDMEILRQSLLIRELKL